MNNDAKQKMAYTIIEQTWRVTGFMRTWKQGRIGKIALPDATILYMKCLKYPLAQFYARFDISTNKLDGFLFNALIDKAILRYIENIGQSIYDKKDEMKSNQNYDICTLDELQKLILLKGSD